MISQNKNQNETAWYLVSTHGRKERFACWHLNRQGFVTYLPMRAPARSGAPAQPFLPGYLFVQVDMAKPGWRAIYATLGVKSVLSVGQGESLRPQAMPRALVPMLKGQEREGLIWLAAEAPARTEAPAVAIQPGAVVKVDLGVAGMVDAVMAERIDSKRTYVLISLLGRESRVVVNSASVVRSSAVAVKGRAA